MVNLEALTFWMAEKDKKAMKLLSAGPSAVISMSWPSKKLWEGLPEIGGLRTDSKTRARSHLSIQFCSASAEERVVVGGKKVLTTRTPKEGVFDLELKQGRSELSFLMLEPNALESFCWGLRPNLTLAELKNQFESQRKTLIELDLGSIICLPDATPGFSIQWRVEFCRDFT